MNQALVRAALESRLKTWADSQNPVMQVAWENVNFTPPAGRVHLRCFLLRNNTFTVDLKGAHKRFQGFLQVSIVAPLGAGAKAAEEVAQALSDLFDTQAEIFAGASKVWITEPLSVSASQREDAAFVLPCSIPYRCYVGPE